MEFLFLVGVNDTPATNGGNTNSFKFATLKKRLINITKQSNPGSKITLANYFYFIPGVIDFSEKHKDPQEFFEFS
jgi:hypothetical protein